MESVLSLTSALQVKKFILTVKQSRDSYSYNSFFMLSGFEFYFRNTFMRFAGVYIIRDITKKGIKIKIVYCFYLFEKCVNHCLQQKKAYKYK